jgi:hypothetical protein
LSRQLISLATRLISRRCTHTVCEANRVAHASMPLPLDADMRAYSRECRTLADFTRLTLLRTWGGGERVHGHTSERLGTNSETRLKDKLEPRRARGTKPRRPMEWPNDIIGHRRLLQQNLPKAEVDCSQFQHRGARTIRTLGACENGPRTIGRPSATQIASVATSRRLPQPCGSAFNTIKARHTLALSRSN